MATCHRSTAAEPIFTTITGVGLVRSAAGLNWAKWLSKPMARPARLEYPGAMHPAMRRSDRREDIYLDDGDRQDLLKTLAEAGQKTGWPVPTDVRMSHHD